jgi:hypothetical protein
LGRVSIPLCPRAFQDISTSFNQSIEDRDTGRNRELQHEQQIQQQILDVNLTAHGRVTEDLERNLQEQDQDRQRSFQRQQQDALEAIQRQFDVQNLARNRTLDDAERQKQLARDLSRATSGTDRTRIQQAFADQEELLKDRRTREDNEAKVHELQQEELKKARQKQEDELLNVTRTTARAELAIRRAFADADRDYRIQKEFELLAVKFALDDKFRSQTRQLQQTQDIPQQRQLEDLRTQTEQNIQDTILQPLQDQIAQQQKTVKIRLGLTMQSARHKKL